MPISLNKSQGRLLSRLAIVESALIRQSNISKQRWVDRQAMQEGLVSILWQTWSSFAREVIIQSSKGATTTAGISTSSAFQALSLDQILYVGARAAKKQAYNSPSTLKGSHQEPTWGDFNKSGLAIQALQPSNSQQLSSGLGSPTSIIDLQLCRNASAHVSNDNLAAVRSATARYLPLRNDHPSDMCFWIEPTTEEFLFKVWIGEMRSASALAIR